VNSGPVPTVTSHTQGVREVLLELLLDSANTFVTLAPTEALLRREDTAEVGVFERDRDTALMTCRGLLNDPPRMPTCSAERSSSSPRSRTFNR